MNFEFNKVAGAVLGTALGVMAVGIVADMIYAPPHHEKPGYVIAVAEPGAGGEGPEGPAAPWSRRSPTGCRPRAPSRARTMSASARPATPSRRASPNKVGPNLWGVVGANVVHGDFDYSDAMRAKGAEGMTWTYDNLDHFIENPKGFIPGTAMSYAGVKNPEERADIIAYLRTLSDNPVPLPPPTPAPTAEAPPLRRPPAKRRPRRRPERLRTNAARRRAPGAEAPPAAEPPAAEPAPPRISSG